MADPYFDDVVLLLHGEGADGSTTFTDVKGHTISRTGSTEIDTAQFRYGSASIWCNPAAMGTLFTADSADFEFGSGDFTIEFSWRPFNDASDSVYIMGKTNSIFTVGSFLISFHNASNEVRFFASSNGSSYNVVSDLSMGTAASSTWADYAVTRSGNTWRTYKNGTKISEATASGTLVDNSLQLSIFGITTGSAAAGHFDEVRITKGVARYTGESYTPEGAAFPDEAEPEPSAYEYTPTGGMLMGGPGDYDYFAVTAHEYTPSGGSVMGGTGVYSFDSMATEFTYSPSGGMLMGGTGASVYTPEPTQLTATLAIPAFTVEGAITNEFLYGAVAIPAFQMQGSMLSGATLAGAVMMPAFTLRADMGMKGEVAMSFSMTGTLVSGSALAGGATLPAMMASGSLSQSSVYTGGVTFPSFRLAASMLPESLLSLSGGMPRYLVTGSMLSGSAMAGGIELPAFEMAGIHYGPYLYTGGITLPAFQVRASLLAEIAEAYRTWVVNTRKKAMTEYDFEFNSYAKFRGVLLSAGADGVFAHEGQDADAGLAISARARTGKENFGTTYNKRVPRIYATYKGTGSMKFKTVTSQDGERTYLLSHNGITDIQTRRIPVGRGPKSAQWQFEFQNVDGADFTFENLQAYPEKTSRRVV